MKDLYSTMDEPFRKFYLIVSLPRQKGCTFAAVNLRRGMRWSGTIGGMAVCLILPTSVQVTSLD